MKKNLHLLFAFWFLLAYVAIGQGPVVYLPLDDNLNDASGNGLNATDAGTEVTQFVNDPVRGKVAFFPTKAHAVLPKVDALRFGPGQDFAFAFWLKMNPTPGDPAILSNKDWGNGRNKGFVLFSQSANPGDYNWTINFCDGKVEDGGTGNRKYWQAFAQGAPDAIDGTWHFIAASFNRDDTLRVFLDGEEMPSTVYLGDAPGYAYDNVNDYPITIMQDGTGTYSPDTSAYIDDLKIWNRTITASEVKKLYEETLKPRSEPVVYLPLDDNLNDASGNGLNATDAGTEVTQFVNDPVRGKVAFFPTKAHAVLPKVDALRFGPGQDFAFAFWLKMNPTPGDPAILSNKDWGNGRNKGFVLFSQSANPGDYNWTINFCDGKVEDGGTGNRKYWQAFAQGAPDAIDGTWHFIAASFNRDDTLRVFLDGEEMPSTVYLGDVPGYAYDNVNDYPITIMQDGTGTYSPDTSAYIDELRIWNRVIFADEVKELYQSTYVGVSKRSVPGQNILVFPNPAKDIINLQFNAVTQSNTHILIYNNIGMLIRDVTRQSVTGRNEVAIDVRGWQPGIYLIKVVSGNNSQVVRFIVAD